MQTITTKVAAVAILLGLVGGVASAVRPHSGGATVAVHDTADVCAIAASFQGDHATRNAVRAAMGCAPESVRH
ncbi:hypothetical protein [Ramlibacter sp. WS9]|uniref:hypothetical protein n=1 Tax=Ramlibacter sp. WS9 TaxID=1882741 RepID=UPI0011448060|nr:hypothetical protein [Ramlibacter sp. WS9]ROZ68599.1 hypothetical protein EEB15_25285 [Ramlibacter sp. WS9]